MKYVSRLVLLLASCASQHPLATEALVPGGLSYVALAPGGQRILEGTLNLEFPDDSTITGSWSIHWSAGADTSLRVGEQVGTGQLRGNRRNGSIYLDLNPGWADNNVILVATPVSDGWSGTWGWDTIVGVQTTGAFSATHP